MSKESRIILSDEPEVLAGKLFREPNAQQARALHETTSGINDGPDIDINSSTERAMNAGSYDVGIIYLESEIKRSGGNLLAGVYYSPHSE